jgi:signal peptidase
MSKTRASSRQQQKKRETMVSLLIIVVAVGGTYGFYWALRVGLGTEVPLVVVTSGSMETVISRGDLLLVGSKAPAEIRNGTADAKNGDIIIYDSNGLWPKPQNIPIVHRVVGKEYRAQEGKYYFMTKGDANPYPDPPNTPSAIWVPEDHILGVVVGIIPYVGHLKLFLDTGINLYLALGGVAFLLVLSMVFEKPDPEDEAAEIKARAIAASERT